VWKGIEVIEGMRGHTSGLAIPSFVVDATAEAARSRSSPSTSFHVDNEVMLRIRRRDNQVL